MKYIGGANEKKIELFLKTCRLSLEENKDIDFIEMTMGEFLEGLGEEEMTEELAFLLLDRFMEIDIYLTDGLTRLRAGKSRYSRKITDLKKDEKIRIYSY